LLGLHIGAAAIEAAYNDLESVLKELQALHKQADAALEQTASNTASSAGSNSFRRQQERNAAIEKIQAVLPFLEAELLDAAHDDPVSDSLLNLREKLGFSHESPSMTYTLCIVTVHNHK